MIHSDLTTFRLELSEEALESADLLMKNEKYRSAVNRMYFAIYYKLLALADKNNSHPADFKELKQWLEKSYVEKKTLFESDLMVLSQIFQESQEIDYTDFSDITEDITAGLFTKTKMFLTKLDKLITDSQHSQHEMADSDIYNSEKILVPWDFSIVAENALEHAIQFAKTTGGYITLLHLVKKQKEVTPALKLLDEIAEKTKHKFANVSEVIVKVGNIFEDINDIAAELNAKMIIMGTHGITGMQKFTGSKALKVISGTQIPFVVIQDKPSGNQIKDVILPIDDRKEIRQKMNQVRFLAKLYDVKFHLCIPLANKVEGVLKRLHNNVNFVKSFLKQYNIDYEVHEFAQIKDVVQAVSILCEQINPDLILVITTKDIQATDYLLGADEQKIIANEKKIPVMCISPIKAKSYRFNSANA